MAEVGLQNLAQTLRNQNLNQGMMLARPTSISQPITINQNSDSKDIINTIQSGDNSINNSLNKIFNVLQQQFMLQNQMMQQQRIAANIQPKEFETKEGGITATREKELAFLEKIADKLDKLSDGGGSGFGGLLAGYGTIKAIEALTTGIKNILPELLSFGKGLATAALKWGAFLELLNQISPSIRRGLGLPSMEDDPFNMNRFMRTPGPRYNRPMSPDEFQRERIPATEGGEATRAARMSRTADTTTMSKLQSIENVKGKDKLMSQTFNAFVNAGFSENQAKSLVAEVGRENSFNPQTLFGRHTDPYNKVTNVGMFSWQGKRGQELEKILNEKELIKDGKLVQSQETLNEMAKFAKSEMETKSEYSRTKEQFLKNPNIGSEEAAEVLGKNYVKWRFDDPRYASGHKNRKYYLSKIERLRQENPEGTTIDRSETTTRVNNQAETSPTNLTPQNMVDTAELRVKGGLQGQAFKGGETAEGTLNLARRLQALEQDLPGGLNRFSSFNDAYHRKANPKSKHTQGLALDFSLKDSKQSSEASDFVKNQLLSSGLSEKDFKIINEYKSPSKHATGGHIHVNFTNKESAERYAQFTKGSQQSTYAKAEKEIPEGRGRPEEESEMEETNEPVLTEFDSTSKAELTSKGSLAEAQQKYYEQSTKLLDSINKNTKKSADKSEEKKESETATKEEKSEAEKTMDSLFDEGEPTPFGNMGGIIQPIPGGGIFGQMGNMGGFGNNPFGSIQGVLGGLGSAVGMGAGIAGMGRSMGSMGGMGGIYGAQGAIGGIQGILGSLGMQSPVLGGLGQAAGSIGGVMSSVEMMKNMGNMGGGLGGIMGGIGAASAGVGALGGLFETGKGLFGGMFGGDSNASNVPTQGRFGQRLADTPKEESMFGSIGESISNFFGGNTNASNVPTQGRFGKTLGETPTISSMGAGSDIASINAKYAGTSGSARGEALEGMSRNVEEGKEDRMSSDQPIIVEGGGGSGGASGPQGGGGSGTPSPSGVMGMGIEVRDPAMWTHMFEFSRIV